MIPYHTKRGITPSIHQLLLRFFSPGSSPKTNGSTEGKKTKKEKASNGPNEKSCIRSPTFIPAVSLLMISQPVCTQVAFFSVSGDRYGDRDPGADLQERKICTNQTRDPEMEERHGLFFEGFQPRQWVDSAGSVRKIRSPPCTGAPLAFCFLFYARQSQTVKRIKANNI